MISWGYGGPGGARTHDPKIKSLVLYQLSYRPTPAALNAKPRRRSRRSAPCRLPRQYVRKIRSISVGSRVTVSASANRMRAFCGFRLSAIRIPASRNRVLR